MDLRCCCSVLMHFRSASRAQSASLLALHAVTKLLSENTTLSSLFSCKYDVDNTSNLNSDQLQFLKSNSLSQYVYLAIVATAVLTRCQRTSFRRGFLTSTQLRRCKDLTCCNTTSRRQCWECPCCRRLLDNCRCWHSLGRVNYFGSSGTCNR